MASRPARDPDELAAWFDEISLLALEGDATGLASRVAALATEQADAARAAGPGGAHSADV